MTRLQIVTVVVVLAGLAVALALTARAAARDGAETPAPPAASAQQEHEHDHDHDREHGQHRQEHERHGHDHEGHGDAHMRHEGSADHSFADAERWAERFESAERAEWQMPDRVVAAFGLKPGDSVADIGSGTGYFARRFAAAVAPSGTVYATDIEPGMAAYVRDRADREGQRNLVPVVASRDDPRLPDGAADLVFICNTWHHIDDRVEYARRLKADLAAGGRVAIVDFLPGELPVGPPPSEKLAAAEVTAEFAAAGFRLAASPAFLPYQYILVFEPAGGEQPAAPGAVRRTDAGE